MVNRWRKSWRFVCVPLIAVAAVGLAWTAHQQQARSDDQEQLDTGVQDVRPSAPEPKEIPEFVEKGIRWLIQAQHPDGGWGAGSHANQQNRDPHSVQVDPATTATVCTTLVRAGHTPVSGQYKDAVRRGTEYLCTVIEQYDKPGPRITDLTGTQIQAKLGPLVDTVMTSHFLTRVLTTIPKDDPLHKRIDKCLAICLDKLQKSQAEDGSWNSGGGWAPVLLSSFACSTLELAEANGVNINVRNLQRARDYHKSNFDRKSGAINAEAGAGVRLYAYSSSQRANAPEARAAAELIRKAQDDGKLDKSAEVTVENLVAAGVEGEAAERLAEANANLAAQVQQLDNEQLLRGFGNNGGEEYLSYLQTSESLVIAGGKPWEEWNEKMRARLAKIQGNDGSWTGQHCITSPVFCTAAVVQCLTTDRDAPMLIQLAKRAAKQRAGNDDGTRQP